jgi:hypothetical protein
VHTQPALLVVRLEAHPLGLRTIQMPEPVRRRPTLTLIPPRDPPCFNTATACPSPGAPARCGLQSAYADAPAGGQLLLIEVSDFHLGLLPNELAGVHEGAVPLVSQAISKWIDYASSGGNGISRSTEMLPTSD